MELKGIVHYRGVVFSSWDSLFLFDIQCSYKILVYTTRAVKCYDSISTGVARVSFHRLFRFIVFSILFMS
jgi:hypothetical protein